MDQQEKPPTDDPTTQEIMVDHGEDELQPFDVQQLAERLVREVGISSELAD